MKRLIEDVDGEGLLKLMGKQVTFFCMNYIYTGKLVGVNEKEVMLSDASIVYETGSFSDSAWKDVQKLPEDVYIFLNSVESYMVLK